MIKKIIILLMSIAVSASAEYGTRGMETLNLSSGARSFGLADTGSAFSSDVRSINLLSAGMYRIRGVEFCLNGNEYISDSRFGTVSMVLPMSLGLAGLSLSFFNYGQTEFRTGDSEIPDSLFNPSDFSVVVHFIKEVTADWPIGVNIKYVSETLSEDSSGSGFVFDINTLVPPWFGRRVGIALALNNMGIGPDLGTVIPMPISFRIGLSHLTELKSPVMGIYDILNLFDMKYTLDGKFQAAYGFELAWHHLAGEMSAFLRAGYEYPLDTGYLSGLHAGAGVLFKNYGIDYGFGTRGDLGLVHELSLTLKLKPPEPPRYIKKTSQRTIERTLQEFDENEKKSEESRPEPDLDDSFEETPPGEPDYDFEE